MRLAPPGKYQPCFAFCEEGYADFEPVAIVSAPWQPTPQWSGGRFGSRRVGGWPRSPRGAPEAGAPSTRRARRRSKQVAIAFGVIKALRHLIGGSRFLEGNAHEREALRLRNTDKSDRFEMS
jgi:hypothetical protein